MFDPNKDPKTNKSLDISPSQAGALGNLAERLIFIKSALPEQDRKAELDLEVRRQLDALGAYVKKEADLNPHTSRGLKIAAYSVGYGASLHTEVPEVHLGQLDALQATDPFVGHDQSRWFAETVEGAREITADETDRDNRFRDFATARLEYLDSQAANGDDVQGLSLATAGFLTGAAPSAHIQAAVQQRFADAVMVQGA